MTQTEKADNPCHQQHPNVIKVPLNDPGEYVIFPVTTYHRGYYNGDIQNTFFTVQLFAEYKSSYRVHTSRIDHSQYYQLQSVLPCEVTSLFNDLRCYWDIHYPSSEYPPPKKYKLVDVDVSSNRVVDKASFCNTRSFLKDLISMFETRYPQLSFQSVWLIRKRDDGDGFQRWHKDLVNNAKTAITIVVNVGSYVNPNPPPPHRDKNEDGDVPTNTETAGIEMTDDDDARIRLAYIDWCRKYDKIVDDSRFQTFLSNFLTKEKYCKEKGWEMVLDEYTDCTMEEIRSLKMAHKEAAEPITVPGGAATMAEEDDSSDDSYLEVIEKPFKSTTEKSKILGKTRSGKTPSSQQTELTEAQEKVILVFPFDAKETEMREAASGLKELGGDLLGLDQAHAICAPGQIVEAKTTKRKRGNNKQSTTIRAVDKECLRPGVWLNDVHVNFWMSW